MSVRRLAEDNVQPAQFAFSAENAAWAEATIRKYPAGRQQSAVIPLLMRAQEQDGWVTKAAIESVASLLDMPFIRVLEVATFYTQFQLKPVGKRAHIQVCGTTPCMLRGAEDLINVCRKRIHAEPLHLNDEGTLSWEEVECQGACVNAPMVMIFKDSYEDLTVPQFEYIIDRFNAGKGADITPGPQVDRVYSAPSSGLTTLLDEIVPMSQFAEAAAAPAAEQAPTNAARAETRATEANAAIDTPVTDKAQAAVNAEAKGEVPNAVEQKADAKPSLDDPSRPAGIARPDKKDDLKWISGIGPKIEGILNELGIFTFAQVAAWTPEQQAWVEGYLNFRGRIERDDWINQSTVLARGGEAEYVKVFGKKPR